MTIVKNGLIFGSGAAVGAGVMWYFMQKKVREANEATQKAVDQVKEAYAQSQKNQEKKGEISISSGGNTVRVSEGNDSEDNNESVSSGESKTEYHELTKTYNVFDEVEKASDPYIKEITAEEYEENQEDVHVELTYFSKDDMVVYSRNLLPLDYPEEELGEDFKEKLDGFDAIYISNEHTGCMYELSLDDENTLNALIGQMELEDQIAEDIEAEAKGGV